MRTDFSKVAIDMDAMAYSLTPRYFTDKGYVVERHATPAGDRLTICLSSGRYAAAPVRDGAWQVGNKVEVLIARVLGHDQGIAVRSASAAAIAR